MTESYDDILEMPGLFPNLKLVKHIANPNSHTSLAPNGIGISIYQNF